MFKLLLRILLSVVIVIAAGLAVGFAWQSYADARNLAQYPAPGAMIDVGGRKLHLRCKGDAAGPTVVIEAGLADLSAHFWPVSERIAAFARVCTYDRAGYAWSDPAPAGRTMRDVARDLHTLLVNANVPGPYVLVAHSFGGFYVRLFAAEYGGVAGMVLIDTSDETFNLSPAGRAVAPGIATIMTVGEWASRFSLIRPLLAVTGEADTDVLPPDAEAMNLRPSEMAAARDEIAGSLLHPANTEVGGSLGAMPLIVLSHNPDPPGGGEREAEWSAGQKHLVSLSTGSRQIVTTGSHLIYREQPDLVVDSVRQVFIAARDGTTLR